ncbi:hypothetical protein BH10ACI4_BH10ACI4_28360 [soil metagenome]
MCRTNQTILIVRTSNGYEITNEHGGDQRVVKDWPAVVLILGQSGLTNSEISIAKEELDIARCTVFTPH